MFACAQLSLYLSLAPEEKLKYPLGGPAALEAFNGGKDGFEARSFRGLGVFVSTPVRGVSNRGCPAARAVCAADAACPAGSTRCPTVRGGGRLDPRRRRAAAPAR